METSHPFRSSAAPAVAPRRARAWSEVDAELVIAFFSAAMIVSSIFGHLDRTGLTLGLLGWVGSLCSIVAWLRRTPHDDHDRPRDGDRGTVPGDARLAQPRRQSEPTARA